jgi:hypothetical protein
MVGCTHHYAMSVYGPKLAAHGIELRDAFDVDRRRLPQAVPTWADVVLLVTSAFPGGHSGSTRLVRLCEAAGVPYVPVEHRYARSIAALERHGFPLRGGGTDMDTETNGSGFSPQQRRELAMILLAERPQADNETLYDLMDARVGAAIPRTPAPLSEARKAMGIVRKMGPRGEWRTIVDAGIYRGACERFGVEPAQLPGADDTDDTDAAPDVAPALIAAPQEHIEATVRALDALAGAQEPGAAPADGLPEWLPRDAREALTMFRDALADADMKLLSLSIEVDRPIVTRQRDRFSL